MAEATQSAATAARPAAQRGGTPQGAEEGEGSNPFAGVVALLKRGDLMFALGVIGILVVLILPMPT